MNSTNERHWAARAVQLQISDWRLLQICSLRSASTSSQISSTLLEMEIARLISGDGMTIDTAFFPEFALMAHVLFAPADANVFLQKTPLLSNFADHC
jgi:hypothetical protein